jgi:hypothetical protein
VGNENEQVSNQEVQLVENNGPLADAADPGLGLGDLNSKSSTAGLSYSITAGSSCKNNLFQLTATKDADGSMYYSTQVGISISILMLQYV